MIKPDFTLTNQCTLRAKKPIAAKVNINSSATAKLTTTINRTAGRKKTTSFKMTNRIFTKAKMKHRPMFSGLAPC